MPVPDGVDERKQDVESGIQGRRVLAQPFDDICALLRHNDCGLGDDIQDQQGQYEHHEGSCRHANLLHHRLSERERLFACDHERQTLDPGDFSSLALVKTTGADIFRRPGRAA